MAKFNINIEKANKYNEFETIVEIDINNGNWKYWDTYMETDEKMSLTINNIGEAYYLTQPVKDAGNFHDHELYEKTGEFKVVGANVNTFNTLTEFINCRLNNVKEDVKSNIYNIVYAKKGGRTFNAVLFNEQRRSKDIVEDITYSDATQIRMTIKLVE